MTVSDAELFERFPGTPLDHDNKAYYRGLLERRLVLNRCDGCDRWHHPPLPQCPGCWSTSVNPTPVSGRGTVFLLSLMHQGPLHAEVEYPHLVATVELVEQPGLRVTTALKAPAERAHIGMPVRLAWVERGGNPFPVFEPDVEGGHV